MVIHLGREIAGDFEAAESREWLVTNGMGGFASGTVAGLLTRRYHGLLMAALRPPLGRTLLLAKLDETALYNEHLYPFYANRWTHGVIDPLGYQNIEHFHLEGTMPVWRFACGDALVEKRVWMQQGANTTYIHYRLTRASQPLTLTLKALVNYRDYHSLTQALSWQMDIIPMKQGLCVLAFAGAVPIYLLARGSSDRLSILPAHNWYRGFELSLETERGLSDREDHLHVGTIQATLQPGETLTLVASTEPAPNLEGEVALASQQVGEQKLLKAWKAAQPIDAKDSPLWIKHLLLAADQFIVSRASRAEPNGKTIIAGYPWFGDWGRDTMISLPGLTLSTHRSGIARSILRTFAQYVDQGMLPNRFPDVGEVPEYNTVDATLWYFEAIWAYYLATEDDGLLRELFPVLAEIIDWHCRGTRYNIHLDPVDGLLYAGEGGGN